MHSCPRVIPLAPTLSLTEHVSVGPVGFAGGEIGPEVGLLPRLEPWREFRLFYTMSIWSH